MPIHTTSARGEAIEAAALALRAARAQRRMIAPISATHGIERLDEAYAVARINTAARLAEGRRVVGRKVGLTARAVQRQLGVDQPDFGILFDDMELLNRSEVPMARLLQPKAEAEVAFVLGRDLQGARPSWGEFLGALAYALPAIEIVDSAIADWNIALADTVADNASCGLYVLGDQPVAVGAVSLGALGMQLTLNGSVASVGGGAACLDHPLRAAYWVVCEMLAREHTLRAGEVILSGALGPMVPVDAGDQIEVHIGALGGVACRMSA
jgi:2-keto-4-pentenoate hydratase